MINSYLVKASRTHTEGRIASSINIIGKLGVHMQKSKTGPLPYTQIEVILKWAKNLNVRPKTLKHLKEHIREKLFDFGLINDYLSITPNTWSSLAAQTVKNLPAMQETGVQSLVQKDALETHSSTLAWKNPMDRGAWWATVHGVTKSWTWLSD